MKYKLISGKKIKALITKDIEGFDINSKIDYEYAKLINKNNDFEIFTQIQFFWKINAC